MMQASPLLKTKPEKKVKKEIKEEEDDEVKFILIPKMIPFRNST